MVAQIDSELTEKSPVRGHNLLDALLLFAWFGLVTGLVEGIALWFLKRLDWLSGVYYFLGSSLQIVWISTAFDFLLFLLVGFNIGIIASMFKRLPILSLGIYVLTFLTLFDGIVALLHPYVRIHGLVLLTAGLALWPARWLIRNQERLLIFCCRSLPVVVGIGALAFVLIQGGYWLREEITVSLLPEAKLGSPNVIVIVIDTLRADHLSSYGYTRLTSPTIDRLSRAGVLFENAITPAPWTKPVHASLLTGRYPHEHGADDDRSLDNRYPTIGEVLQTRGYRTGAFSANYETFNQMNGFGRGFLHFEDFYQSPQNKIAHTLYGRVLEYYVFHKLFGMEYRLDRKLALEINESLFTWIDREKEKPFFAFLNYYDVHLPYTPPQPYRSKFSHIENPGGLMNTDWGMDQIYLDLTPEQVQGEIDAYDGAIAYVDDSIKHLIDELIIRGLMENTIIIILSDHGESFGEHGLFEHNNSLYREIIHVPLIFWWPGHIPNNTIIEQPVSTTALPATIFRLLDSSSETFSISQGLNNMWQKPVSQQAWLAPIAEAAQISWVPPQHLTFSGSMRSIIDLDWQYIEHDQFGEELYSWAGDPDQENNQAKNPQYEEVLSDLSRELNKALGK